MYDEVLGGSTRCYRLIPVGLSAIHSLLAIFGAPGPVAGSHYICLQVPVIFLHVHLGLKFPFYKDASHIGWGPPFCVTST